MPKNRINAPHLHALVLSLVMFPALADRIHFADGESLSGELVALGDGQVAWHSENLGALIIEQHKIEAIESGKRYDLKVGGRELNNCWMYVQNAQQYLHCDEGVQTLSSWKLVIAAGETLTEPVPLLAQKGVVNISGEDSSGNNELTKYNVDMRSELRYIESRHTLAARYQEESAEQETTRDMWRTSYQYDQFFTEQWFATGNALYEEDEFKQIERRSSFGAGMGYQFLETSYVDLLGKATVNYIDERFTGSVEREAPAFVWNLDFAWRFNDRGMEFYHRHVVWQAFNDSDDYELNTLTGFSYPINGHFSSMIQLQYDYDNLPAQDQVEKKDQTWSIGVNYHW